MSNNTADGDVEDDTSCITSHVRRWTHIERQRRRQAGEIARDRRRQAEHRRAAVKQMTLVELLEAAGVGA